MLEGRTVLIVEDGNEYLDNLSRFVAGPRYLQAHDGSSALEVLRQGPVDLLYLDMRFDRIELGQLLGDHALATREHNQDPHKAWKYLQNNQGLFVLEAVRAAGFVGVPVVLAYDFSREEKRFSHLKRLHPSLNWVPDAVTPSEIVALMERLVR
jgi:CheY-like chemotaxis protein